MQKGAFIKKESRQWFVLTEHFGHFLLSPEDKKPFKSIPILELSTEPLQERGEGAPGIEKDGSHGFRLSYHDKTYDSYCEGEDEAKGWVNAIKRLRERRMQVAAVKGTRVMTALEQRIQTHLSGMQAQYSAKCVGWEGKGGVIEFVFQVRPVCSNVIFVLKIIVSMHDVLFSPE